MTNTELLAKIKAEIERRMKELRGQEKDFLEQDCHTLVEDARLRIGELNQLLSFLDTLEKSERPEPYNPVYDEAYLNEKIKKATESWKGVDVDAMLAECRGYDEEESEKPMNQEGLEEEYKDYVERDPVFSKLVNRNAGLVIARHFAQWGAEHAKKEELPVSGNLEEAAEEYLQKVEAGFLRTLEHPTAKDCFKDGAKWDREQMLKEAVEAEISAKFPIVGRSLISVIGMLEGFKYGDKVRIIIVKED